MKIEKGRKAESNSERGIEKKEERERKGVERDKSEKET
jgi:hypothetical protein